MLRKKIEAASGMPPSLLKNKTFWSKPIDVVSAWIIEMLDEAAHPRLNGRRVISGKLIGDIDPEGLLFNFQADQHTGISAIILGHQFVSFFTARRLECPVEEADSVSELFKRLALEDAALHLYQGLQMSLEISDEMVDPRAALGNVELSSRKRYLTVTLTFTLGNEPYDLHLVLNYEAIRAGLKNGGLGGGKGGYKNSHKVLQDTIQATELTVTAVIDDLHMNVGECSRLEIGSVLALEGAELSRLRLIANTMSGKSEIATGELGVWKTNRALKLHTAVAEDFARDFTGH